MNNEGLEEFESLFGVESEDWGMINALFKSSGIVRADCTAFRAMIHDMEGASKQREEHEKERAAQRQAIEDYAKLASTKIE